MFKLKTTLAAATLLLGSHSAFAWTTYDNGVNALMAQSNNLTRQMNQFQHNMTVGAMNDPRVQQGYRQYRAQGGYQDFATWALNYRATMGYNPGLMRQVYAQNAANAARVQQSWQGLQLAQAQRAAAQRAYMTGWSNIQNQQGMLNAGYRYYMGTDGRWHWFRP